MTHKVERERNSHGCMETTRLEEEGTLDNSRNFCNEDCQTTLTKTQVLLQLKTQYRRERNGGMAARWGQWVW